SEALMKPYLLGVIFSALSVYVWGFIFWSSPLPYHAFKQSTNDSEVQQLLENYFPEDGLYAVPGMHHPPEELARMHQQGPRALLRLKHGGAPLPDPKTMALGLLHNLVMAAWFAFLCKLLLGEVSRYFQRVLWIVLIGLAGAVFVLWGDTIWWYQPWSFLVVNLGYHLGAFFIMGLVLAYFLRPGSVTSLG
ncbi:MAG: DUF1761 family protein, partial [Calditrichaeota bacterium]